MAWSTVIGVKNTSTTAMVRNERLALTRWRHMLTLHPLFPGGMWKNKHDAVSAKMPKGQSRKLPGTAGPSDEAQDDDMGDVN